MPSPRFGVKGVLVDAVAIAIRDGWAVPDPAQRPRVLQASLRRALGDEAAGRALDAALDLMRLQPAAPSGDSEPPTAALALCGRCREIKLKEERRPYKGKVKMELLRDAAWMRRQIEQRRRDDAAIAKELGCCVASVAMWRRRHEIDPPKMQQPWMSEAVMRRLIVTERKAPGEIAELLGCEPHTARNWGRELGIVGPDNKPGNGLLRWPHFERAWWVERVALGLTQYAMAKAAGIKPHAAVYHLKRWGLLREHLSLADRARLRKPKFKQLYEPGWLRCQLIEKGRTKAAIARQVGCEPTAVTHVARKLGIEAPQPAVPSPWTRDPAWYRERFARKLSLAQLAAEAGCSPKSIQNYIGELGLADEFWRTVERWSDASLKKSRRAHAARQGVSV